MALHAFAVRDVELGFELVFLFSNFFREFYAHQKRGVLVVFQPFRSFAGQPVDVGKLASAKKAWFSWWSALLEALQEVKGHVGRAMGDQRLQQSDSVRIVG
jgi:hypothetical protein